MSFRPCVGSGKCCKTGPCAFGTWDESKHQCIHLEVVHTTHGIDMHRCAHFEFIQRQAGSELNPAFGAGCCQPLFNTARQQILDLIKSGEVKPFSKPQP